MKRFRFLPLALILVLASLLPCFAGVENSGREYTECIGQMLDTFGNGQGSFDQAVAVKTVTGVTTATPAVVTLASHGYPNGTYLFLEGTVGTTEINGLRVVTSSLTNTFELLTPAGAVIGSRETFVSGGTCAPAYVYKPPTNKKAVIMRIVGYAHDGDYNSTKYLGITALSKGIEVFLYENDTRKAPLTVAPVKIWLQWSLNAGTDVGNSDAGAGLQTQTALRWSFFKGCGPLQVDGKKHQLIVLIIRDTLTGLLGQEMSIQGHF